MEENYSYVYMYRKNRKNYYITKDVIMYIQCHGRVLHIAMPFASLEHNGTLHSARQMLGEDEFVQVNKSELVNLRYVFYTDLTSVIMWDKTVIPVTPAYSAQLSSKMINMYKRKDGLL